MENTIENKTKLFVQYWGQTIMRYENSDFVTTIHEHNLEEIPLSYLQLKHTNKITTSDLYKLDLITNDSESVNIYSNGTYEVIKGVHIIYMGCLEIYQIDLLRSLGYAVEFMGVSIHQQMSYGWIKLTTSNNTYK